MNNGYYYQLLATLVQANNQFNLPRSLKEVVRNGSFEDVKAVEDAVFQEASECSLVESNGGNYFTTMASTALMFALMRQDMVRYTEISEMMSKRLETASMVGAGIATETWAQFLQFVNSGANRISRNITIEDFEAQLDGLEWGNFDNSFTCRIALVIGYVYMNEESTDRITMARAWLQKAVRDWESGFSFAAAALLTNFLVSDGSADNRRRHEEMVKTLEEAASKESNPVLQRIRNIFLTDIKATAVLLHAVVGGDDAFDDDQIKLVENYPDVRDLAARLNAEAPGYFAFTNSYLKTRLADSYLVFASGDIDTDDATELLNIAIEEYNHALALAAKTKDEVLAQYIRYRLLSIHCRLGSKNAEKELKEMLTDARKSDNMPWLMKVSRLAASFYNANRYGSNKAYEILADTMRRGAKRIETGGYYLVTSCMADINKLINAEAEKPGISWIVRDLESYFTMLSEIIDGIENHKERIGAEMFADLQKAFNAMEPATHHHIKVYLRYQYYEVKMLRLGALIREDELSVRIADKLIAELCSPNNPLTLIRAAWEDFKDEPNGVRNKVVNKCISISKGDLPMAAEHLDFSYRNLRSYITFNEVNRLGFFLNEQQTSNKQLEQGIRLMFFDLYKNGTIFEVVFDMPKFLVANAKTGFFSQDLEEALDIKGTTTKKYIKIMIDIGLIKLERSMGRKHLYRLRKDVIMSRLAKEQPVIAG